VRHARRVAPTWLALLALGVSAAPARAEPAAEAVRLDYSAPAECPDAASFRTRVRERTARGRFAEPGELARTFVIALRADPSGYSGSIEFLDDNATSVSRRLHGEQCDAVVSSLALITALALDSALRSEEAEEPARRPDAPAAAAPAPRAPSPSPPVEPASSTRVKVSSLEQVRFGLLTGYGTALAAPRLGLLAELAWRSRVALRLSAHYDWNERTTDPERTATLRRQGLEVSLCPRRFRFAVWVVAPCVAFDFGSLRAAGVKSSRLISVRADTIWWASVGAQLAVALEPAGPFWLELRAGAELPLRAGYQFTFDNPRGVAYEVPDFAGNLAIAGGVRFW
jgi:hypothetical protein